MTLHVPNAGMDEKWLSADEIADHLGISKDTLYAWISIRGLPAHRVGRLWKFQRTEVDGWVRSGKAGNENEETNEK